jgi:colicin import membrane protein
MSAKAIELIAIETLKAAEVFAEGGAEAAVAAIEATVRAIDTDISTPKDRGAVASLARTVSSTKVKLDSLGKDYVADLKQRAKTVDDERKVIRDRLDTLRDEVRKPLDEFEEKQQARIDEHQAALAEIEQACTFDKAEPTAAEIQDRLDRVGSMGGNRDWEEFAKRAERAREETSTALTAMLKAAQDRAELAKLRAEQAARAEQERIAQAADQAAAKARQEAEAERLRLAREKAEAEIRARLAEERAEQAAAAERQRIADEQAAAEREREKREANRRHRGKIHSAIKAALVPLGMSDDLAVAVVTALAKGDVPHVAINY